ncbi:hypothetical protein MATL_G00257100 [Megalops atlanticus]|uniref:Uncharacterized protein n=1 Tax=Megalops atlanticus TaxID=7932 RepID=A0A9D3PCN5_MEGAT|nr:hypothetical protein MATL_G00257100 [Megalops atlanticus]
MGLCYSLRPRLFGDLSGSISNATSDSDQPPDPSAPLRAGGLRHEETRGYGETAPLRDGQIRRADSGKPSAGELRRGDASTDGVVIQNGGGGGGGGGGGKGGGTERNRRLQLLQKHSTQKQKNWDRLLMEEKEAEREAKKVSKNIDRALKELKREYKQTHRLLLLGRVAQVHRVGRVSLSHVEDRGREFQQSSSSVPVRHVALGTELRTSRGFESRSRHVRLACFSKRSGL